MPGRRDTEHADVVVTIKANADLHARWKALENKYANHGPDVAPGLFHKLADLVEHDGDKTMREIGKWSHNATRYVSECRQTMGGDDDAREAKQLLSETMEHIHGNL